MLIDSHAHLDMQAFEADLPAVIHRAQEAGVGAIITVATSRPGGSSLQTTLDIAGRHANVYAGVGVHPHDAQWADESHLATVADAARHPKVIVWGEIGLDYYYDNSPREVQREIFRQQLRIARAMGLPVAIHCRNAWDDLLAIVRDEWKAGGPGGIMHSFAGSRTDAMEALRLGFHISFSGMVTFKKAGDLRDSARVVPESRLLVETDCPYLAPAPHRGQRNEPAFVVDVVRCIAQLRGTPLEELSAACETNLKALAGGRLASPADGGAGG